MQPNVKLKNISLLLGLLFGQIIISAQPAANIVRALNLAKYVNLKNGQNSSTIGISGTTSQASSMTLSELQTNYSIPSTHVAAASVSWGTNPTTVPGWNLNINNLGKGYAFIADPWNGNIQTRFSAGQGVAAVIDDSVQEAVLTAFKAGSVSLALLAMDAQGIYISDLTQKAPVTMYLYIFDKNGNSISGTPIQFPAVNYVGSTATAATAPAVFTTNGIVMGGFGLSTAQILTYPFALTVTNSAVPQQQVQFPTYNLNNNSLTQLNFDISNQGNSTVYHVPFITSPSGAVAPVVSELSFIPAGTTQFTIAIYGYDVSNKILKNFNDLKSAINGQTLSGFAAYIYDQNNKPLGTPQQISLTLAQQLDAVFNSGIPTVAVSVNGAPVTPSASITYPIRLTLQNISGWAPTSSAATPAAAASTASGSVTLTQMQTALGVTNVSSPMTIALSGQQGQAPLGAIYFYDTSNNMVGVGILSGVSGVNIDISSIVSKLTPPYTIMLVGIDTTQTMMTTLVNSEHTFNNFDVYLFNNAGLSITGSPVVGSSSSAFVSNSILVDTFDRAGIGIENVTSVSNRATYPFIINVTA